MTPDEVVGKEIEAIENILYSDLNLSEGTRQALQSTICLIQDYQKLRERVDMKKISKIIFDKEIEGFEASSTEYISAELAQAIVTYLQQPTEH